jgi:purple acid phosphatase-like protein
MSDTSPTLSRRQALGLLGGAGAAAAIPLLGVTPADAAPAARPQAGTSGAPPVQGLHLAFGADPATQMVASWITEAAVRAPRVLYGTMDGGFGQSGDAQTVTYVDGTSGRTVYVHHAPMSRLRPGTTTSTSCSTTERTPTEERSAPPRADGRRSRSPASVTKRLPR